MGPTEDTDINNFQLTTNFNLREFQCPCCGRVMIHKKLVTILQLTREHLDQPIEITSGFRCHRHNLYVGGWEYSKHLVGKAVDIFLKTPDYKRLLFDMLMEYESDIIYTFHDVKNYLHVELK